MNLAEIGAKIGLYFVPFLFALCFHEFAHAWVARKKGDDTAEVMGRMTMNPLSHIDILGTVILPISAILFGTPFFGWAKPVPVNPRNLDKPREDMFWIAFAGPLSNVLLAIVGVIGLVGVALFAAQASWFGTARNILDMFILINLFLAVFNMIPLHPLDGGKVLARFLPAEMNHKLEANQAMSGYILIAIFLLGGFQYLAYPVYWLKNQMVGLTLMMIGA